MAETGSKKDYTNSKEILTCCGHSAKRHLLIGGTGRRGAEGEYICITGFCKVHRVQVKPQGRARRKAKETIDDGIF